MIKVGLSGNRYSGKDRVASLFEQIKVPVFHADIILKYLLNCNYEILGEIKSQFGDSVFKDGKLSYKEINEPYLAASYSSFLKRHKKAPYIIYHSSILFETGLNKKMDKNITVFSPQHDRVQRCRYSTQTKVSVIYDLIKSEIKDLDKNNNSDFVIHNYEAGIDVLDTVNQIDRQIIDEIIDQMSPSSKLTSRVEEIMPNFIRIR
jgi:dephospho-CoA kinase